MGEGICQIDNKASFWKFTIPQLCIEESAVKHAIVALGAAFRDYRSSTSRDETSGHYGKAMAILGRTVAPSVVTTLVCCLAFLIIQCLQRNWKEALVHLKSGLTIIKHQVLMVNLDRPADPTAELENDTDTDYIIRVFCMLELSASIKWRFEPIIARLRARPARGLGVSKLHDRRDAHKAVETFCRDVCAWKWDAKGDYAKRGSELLDIGQQLEEKLQSFKGSAVDASLEVDMLHVAFWKELARVTAYGPAHPPEAEACKNIVRVAEDVRRIWGLEKRQFKLGTTILPPLYFVVRNCSCKETRELALNIARGWMQQENFWDGTDGWLRPGWEVKET